MTYLSPLGVCLTLASNTEQSAAMIGGYTMYNMHCHNCNFGLTRPTWTLAWNLLSHDIRWVVHVRLCPSHHRVVRVIFAVWCFAVRPVWPFGVSSCDCNLRWKSLCNGNYLHIDPDHRSYSPFSRSYQRRDLHRTCPDVEECKSAARVVFPLRHTSPCRTLSSSRGQRWKALRESKVHI